jgi:hypothetical protein
MLARPAVEKAQLNSTCRLSTASSVTGFGDISPFGRKKYLQREKIVMPFCQVFDIKNHSALT